MLRNQEKNTILAKKVKLCRTLFSKAFGLMLSRPGKSLIFFFKEENIVPLHMFFVFYQIDVLFLDKNKRVVEIKQNFKPFTFYKPKNKAKWVIELPDNIVAKTRTEIGDTISFK